MTLRLYTNLSLTCSLHFYSQSFVFGWTF